MSSAFIPLCALVLVLSGCTATRSGHFGSLPNREPLVTLIVTENHDLVVHECAGLTKHDFVAGCQRSRLVALNDEQAVRAVMIVRYTDRLPSPVAFEIAGHEICHAIADVQRIPDPCHAENDGMIEAAMPGPVVHRFLQRR